MTNVLVVGSDPTFVREKLTPKLQNHSIQVVGHWGWTDPPKNTLPKNTEGIILIVAEATSSMAAQARSLARNQGISVAEVPRKFSKALDVLHRVGFTNNDTATESEDETATESDIFESILACCREEKVKGRTPSFSEVTEVVTSIHGSDNTVPEAMYKRAVAMVKAEGPPPKPKAEENTFERLVEWAFLYIEEEPERTDDTIVGFLHNEHDFPRGSQYRKAVKTARDNFLAKWGRHYKSLTDQELQQLLAMKTAWCERFIRREMAATGVPPRYPVIRHACKTVFGKSTSDSLIKEARHRIITEFEKAATTNTVSELGAQQEKLDALVSDDTKTPSEKANEIATEMDAVQKELADLADSTDSDEFQLPPWPTTEESWQRAVPQHRLLSQTQDAINLYNSVPPSVANALSNWILEMDAKNENLPVPEVLGDLDQLNGRPLVFASFILQCIPEDAVILRQTLYRAYHLWTRKGTDTRFIVAAGWALQKNFRDLTDTPYLVLDTNDVAEILSADENPENPPETDTNTNFQDQVASLENQVASLENQVALLEKEKAALSEKARESTATAERLAEDLNAKAENHNASLAGLEEKLGELEAALGKAKTDAATAIEDAQKRASQWEDTARQLQSTSNTLETELAQRDLTIANLRDQVNNVESKVIEDLRKARDKAIAEVVKLREDMEARNLGHEETTQDLAIAHKANSELEAKVAKLEAQLLGYAKEPVQAVATPTTSTEMTVRELLMMGYSLVAPTQKS
jgi:hypothetical protein